MIIDELIEFRDAKIKRHEECFLDEDDMITFEMFQKKYDRSYYPRMFSSISNRSLVNAKVTGMQPFINNIYLESIEFCNRTYYCTNKMPRLNNDIYVEMKNFPDYDYLNSIAYEMLIRTKTYQDLKNNIGNIGSDEKEIICNRLGIEIDDVFGLGRASDRYITKEEKSFTNYYFKMTLSDLDCGQDRLVQFYVQKKQVYIVDKINKSILYGTDETNNRVSIERIVSQTYKVVPNITLDEVKKDPSNYFIPAKFDYKAPTRQDKFSAIDKNIPLVALERDFLVSIDDLVPNRIKGTIDFNFTRPLLRFKEMPIVDVPLNLNLSMEELVQQVTKLKEDFRDGNITNPINILYDTKFEFKDLKNITPFKMTKETITQAFFVFDLYRYIDSAMMLHKEKLSELKHLDLKEMEKQIQIKIEEKEKEILNIINRLKEQKEISCKKRIDENKKDLRVAKRKLQKEKEKSKLEINQKYKKYVKDYNSMEALEEIAILHKITPYMCKQYLIFMRRYIDGLKYKELIVGVKVKNH